MKQRVQDELPSCDAVPVEELLAYVDRELDLGRQEVFGAHLRRCPNWQQRIARFDQVKQLLRVHSPMLNDGEASARIIALTSGPARGVPATLQGRPGRGAPATLGAFGRLLGAGHRVLTRLKRLRFGR